jgi:hypothetical protein
MVEMRSQPNFEGTPRKRRASFGKRDSITVDEERVLGQIMQSTMGS